MYIKEEVYMETTGTGILECKMEQCSFNSGSRCMAIAVNIGGPHPACDTFIMDEERAAERDAPVIVGACKVKNCGFNRNLLCVAKNIRVGRHEEHPDCVTFRAR
jgi:hypothetical protein